MRRRLLPPIFVALAWGGIAPLCASEPAAAAKKFPPEQVEFFEKQIRPLLAKNCFECHGPKMQEGGLRLDSRTGVLHGIEGHAAAVPGDPGRSSIIAVTKYDGDVQMPPDGKLPDDELAALTNWVQMGLPWPEETIVASATVSSMTPATANDPPNADTPWSGSMQDRIDRARRDHWAFQPVRKTEPPAIADSAWSLNPIDRFVYAKLAEAGLQPSPPADPRTLIRRAYFDLTGLPPPPEEVEAFVPSPRYDEAYEALLDKLLASPQYGERWARHWLDVARYADTRGYNFAQERRFPFAYTYRDYVIQAFNDDKPYDQFILEQLAADKLPPQPDNRRLAAMGFITCGRQYQGQHDTLDDQIDVVTRGLLGLTTACARCHDHKFDPIPTDDYYSLYGVFRSSHTPDDLPLLGEPKPSPEYDAFRAELAQFDVEKAKYLEDHQRTISDELRSHVGDYLAKIVLDGLTKQQTNELNYSFKNDEPRSQIVRRWRGMLSSNKRKQDGVFVAWDALEALPYEKFAERAPAILADLAKPREPDDSKYVNRIIREALEKSPPKSMVAVAELYGAAFTQVYEDWKKLIEPNGDKPEAATTELDDPDAEALRQVLYRPNSPTVLVVDDVSDILNRKEKDGFKGIEAKADKLVATSPGAPPRAMVLVDDGSLFDPKVFVRGDAARPGKPVPRQFLQILAGDERKPFTDGSGRLGLAQAIVSRDNPLTARVLVNRVWLQHFGRGLVETPSDFGVRTPPPSHPELLDFLAAEFMDEGWSIKRLQRTIMLSQTYRQTSAPPSSELASRATAVDPENHLLWRMNCRRLELESMRDGMLAVAGKLDDQSFGRPVDLWSQPFSTRRTVYGFIDRQDLPGVFSVFDFASPDVTIDQRPRTTVPQQALFAMNSPFVQLQARAVVARSEIADAAEPAAKVDALFRLIYNRRPTSDEAARVRRFVDEAVSAPAESEVWQYGYGGFNTKTRRTKSFTRFEHWTGKDWHVSSEYPDPKLGYVAQNTEGGHPGDSAAFATIARWTSPIDGVVTLGGTLRHPSKEGDGVMARAVSSSHGQLGQWTARARKIETSVERVEVRRGDTIDFLVEPRENPGYDSYSWSPTIRRIEATSPTEWSLSEDFHGPHAHLDVWETLAQVLLMSNEFMFVD